MNKNLKFRVKKKLLWKLKWYTGCQPYVEMDKTHMVKLQIAKPYRSFEIGGSKTEVAINGFMEKMNLFVLIQKIGYFHATEYRWNRKVCLDKESPIN